MFHHCDAVEVKPEPGLFSTWAPRVIVADDITSSRKVVAVFLETAGCEVTTVTNGRELLDAVRCAPFDLILTDIFMPQMNGLEAAAKIRALRTRSRSIPIIAMSAYCASIDFALAGINDFIAKPFSRQSLLEIVNRWLPRNQNVVQALGANRPAR